MKKESDRYVLDAMTECTLDMMDGINVDMNINTDELKNHKKRLNNLKSYLGIPKVRL